MPFALLLLACLLLAAGSGVASAAELFRFWPGEGASEAPGFKRMSEHPCGEVAIAEVAKLPTAKNGPLLSEVVVELNQRGKVIRRWPMPVDYTPQAVRGAELLVTAGEEGFWIRSNGTFRRASAMPAHDYTPFKCDLMSVFGKSEYAGCSIFVDLASKRKRTLGYQGVCT
jgi:hypothetical protein